MQPFLESKYCSHYPSPPQNLINFLVWEKTSVTCINKLITRQTWAYKLYLVTTIPPLPRLPHRITSTFTLSSPINFSTLLLHRRCSFSVKKRSSLSHLHRYSSEHNLFEQKSNIVHHLPPSPQQFQLPLVHFAKWLRLLLWNWISRLQQQYWLHRFAQHSEASPTPALLTNCMHWIRNLNDGN